MQLSGFWREDPGCWREDPQDVVGALTTVAPFPDGGVSPSEADVRLGCKTPLDPGDG